MSYKDLGQHLVTNQGIRSNPVEVLEGSFKAILLLVGLNKTILFRQLRESIDLGVGTESRRQELTASSASLTGSPAKERADFGERYPPGPPLGGFRPYRWGHSGL